METFLDIAPWYIWGLAIYIFIMSLITFLVFGSDKSYAYAGARRTSEKTLLILALIGGTPGAILAMNSFRHKTSKGTFLGKFMLVILIQVVVIGGLVWLLFFRVR